MAFIKNIEHETVLPLAEQVTVQPGQIVSRTLAQNKAVSVTLFAFDKGEEISTHDSTGDAMVQVLEGENAVQRHRDLMGATNPDNALAGTLRADYADSFTENAVHGSDAEESAAREIAYFFTEDEICPR